MSKSYNTAGWRVGFCSGNAEMVKGLATIKGYYDYGVFQAIQIASVIAMRDFARAHAATGASATVRIRCLPGPADAGDPGRRSGSARGVVNPD